MLPMRHCGFGRHRFARPSGPLVGGGWRLDGPNKSCLPALAICLGLAAFSSVTFAQEQTNTTWAVEWARSQLASSVSHLANDNDRLLQGCQCLSRCPRCSEN